MWYIIVAGIIATLAAMVVCFEAGVDKKVNDSLSNEDSIFYTGLCIVFGSLLWLPVLAALVLGVFPYLLGKRIRSKETKN